MAKNTRKPRRRFNLRKVRIAGQVTIGNLGSGSVVKGSISQATVDSMRFISLNLAWTLEDFIAVDDGMEFGVAHSDYTAAEIEECLEAQGSMDIGDKIAQERANRLVRSLGVIDREVLFNDGKKLKTRLNWLMSEGDTLDAWIRNGSGTVWTTGSLLLAVGELWVTVA